MLFSEDRLAYTFDVVKWFSIIHLKNVDFGPNSDRMGVSVAT